MPQEHDRVPSECTRDPQDGQASSKASSKDEVFRESIVVGGGFNCPPNPAPPTHQIQHPWGREETHELQARD